MKEDGRPETASSIRFVRPDESQRQIENRGGSDTSPEAVLVEITHADDDRHMERGPGQGYQEDTVTNASRVQPRPQVS